MVQTKGQIIENSNLLFRLHHQRFYPKEVVTLSVDSPRPRHRADPAQS